MFNLIITKILVRFRLFNRFQVLNLRFISFFIFIFFDLQIFLEETPCVILTHHCISCLNCLVLISVARRTVLRILCKCRLWELLRFFRFFFKYLSGCFSWWNFWNSLIDKILIFRKFFVLRRNFALIQLVTASFDRSLFGNVRNFVTVIKLISTWSK